MNDLDGKYYTVYAHVCPNGKVYIGQTSKVRPSDRWGIDGAGYKRNLLFYGDIMEYGWDNFKHIIICDLLTSEQADYLERYLIRRYNSTSRYCGYNRHPGGKF